MKRQRVLIVDDDEHIRDILIQVLELWGVDLDLATDGREAERLIRRRRYNLIITDYHMPGINGAQLIREIRSRQPSSHVIGITGTENHELMYGAGAECCLQKPFSLLEVKRAVQEYLSV